MGTPNEPVFHRATGPQILPLYGTRCRSTPVFFLQDDHDYFDNDEADDRIVTFPPGHFMLQLGRDAAAVLSGISAGCGAAAGAAGRLRRGSPRGRLGMLRIAALRTACRGVVVRHSPHPDTGRRERGVCWPVVEDWLKARMAAPGVAHVGNVPSNPPGWSAGKWGEPVAAIDTLEPFRVTTLKRPG
jgi:hypothetical protein